MGFEKLNPTQESLLNSSSDNKIIISTTGSGKTFAFLLSAVEFCDTNHQGDTLILAPSRELASQIENVFRESKCGYNITCCYGGHSIRVETRSLDYAPRVIIGTPGRILYHIRKNNFDTSRIGLLIFDEFDKLLEFGFDEEISQIVEGLPNVTQRILSSATSTEQYPDYISNHDFENIVTDIEASSARMNHWRVEAGDKTKDEALLSLICKIGNESTIVFCNFREVSNVVSDYLYDNFVENEYFHGGMEQFDRERALVKFKNGSCNVLVSTDLAARGLDISDVKNIIHYHIPKSLESYTHRNGRSARIDKTGNIYLITSPERNMPEYVEQISEKLELDYSDTTAPLPKYQTIYFGMGRKNKLSKVDIVGFLCQKGGLEKSDIGMIDLKDFHSFVAVKYDLAKQTVKLILNEKIKGKSTKIALSK